jgi:DNA polymerase-3 subunit delta
VAKTRELLPAYLIVGADELKSKTAVKRLKGRLDEGLAAFNLDEMEPSPDMEPGNVVASLNTLPVGPGFRLVVIGKAEKLPKPVSEAIITYLKDPNPGCVLCLVATSLAKSTRLYKAVKAVGEKAVIDCAPKKRWEMAPSVVKMAARYRVGMSDAAATELVSRVGESTLMIDAQLGRLADLCRDKGYIDVEDVERNIARTAEVKPWDFLDAVSQRDAAKALTLYRLMQNPSQVALLSLLTRRVRELVCARALIDRGQARQLASELGRQEWQVRSVAQAARRFTMAQLVSCLGACARCERELKGGADAETAFVSLVLFVCDPVRSA